MARIKAITVGSKTKNWADPQILYCGQSAVDAQAARESAGEDGYVSAGIIMHAQTIGNRFFEVAEPPKAEVVEASPEPTKKRSRRKG